VRNTFKKAEKREKGKEETTLIIMNFSTFEENRNQKL